MITRSEFEDHPAEVAPRLLGMLLVSAVDRPTAIRITEVEAYAPDDPASHSFSGQTARNRSMFGTAGTLYVYRSYGIHWCANVVTGPSGEGAAVLVRGGIPIVGIEIMAERRGRPADLADGPGKLCQAMGIDSAHDGVDLLDPLSPVRLETGTPPESVLTSTRVGISRGVDTPWRFRSIER